MPLLLFFLFSLGFYFPSPPSEVPARAPLETLPPVTWVKGPDFVHLEFLLFSFGFGFFPQKTGIPFFNFKGLQTYINAPYKNSRNNITLRRDRRFPFLNNGASKESAATLRTCEPELELLSLCVSGSFEAQRVPQVVV